MAIWSSPTTMNEVISMFLKPVTQILECSHSFILVRDWYVEYLSQCRKDNITPNPIVSKILNKGTLIGFTESDFVSKSSYRGTTKYFKCNGSVKLSKRFLGKPLGWANYLGFKVTDYDQTVNYLLTYNLGLLQPLKEKMVSEFYPNPDRIDDLYRYEIDPEHFEYNRCWELIPNLSPQEKIVLANLHNEEPFPNSFYENDRGAFSRRVLDYEHQINTNGLETDIRKANGYSLSEYELDTRIEEAREEYYSNVKEGFDYSEWEQSDLYTRVPTEYVDFELYPVRTNCLPKPLKKRGKSPYDTKLGVREWRWFNYYQKPQPNPNWISKKSPKYEYQMTQEEVELSDYDLPENFWEDIEKAYAMRD